MGMDIFRSLIFKALNRLSTPDALHVRTLFTNSVGESVDKVYGVLFGQQLGCLAGFDQKMISHSPDIYVSSHTFHSPLRYSKQLKLVHNLWRLIF